jgi:hypothetical protein
MPNKLIKVAVNPLQQISSLSVENLQCLLSTPNITDNILSTVKMLLLWKKQFTFAFGKANSKHHHGEFKASKAS